MDGQTNIRRKKIKEFILFLPVPSPVNAKGVRKGIQRKTYKTHQLDIWIDKLI